MNKKPNIQAKVIDKTKLIIFGGLAGLGMIALTVILSIWLYTSNNKQGSNIAGEIHKIASTFQVEGLDEVIALEQKFSEAFDELHRFREACLKAWAFTGNIWHPQMISLYEEVLDPIRKLSPSNAIFESRQSSKIRDYIQGKLDAINQKYRDKYPCFRGLDALKKRYPYERVERFIQDYCSEKEHELHDLYKVIREKTVQRALKIRA